MFNYNVFNKKTKLVSVCFTQEELEEFQFEKRQIPLMVDDAFPSFIVQFDNMMSCVECEKQQQNDFKSVDLCNGIIRLKKDYETFLKKYNQLVKCHQNSDLSDTSLNTIEAKPNDLINTISQLVPCIGCRSSVERFYKQIIKQQQPKKASLSLSNNKSMQSSFSFTLDPIIINSNGNLTLSKYFLSNPMSFFKFFYSNGLDTSLDSILKIKKNRRCHLHSLEAHKQKSINDWLPIWDALLDDECRKRAIIIETNQLLVTLDVYLRKHKFCGDCKLKVIRAYNILIGELDSSKEKGFCPALYNGIEHCSSNEFKHKKHIHILNDKTFVSNLISKAETEIQGNRRERHAKTLDIAQEEVLTCIGIYLYERFHRISQSLRAEEQTWQLLFYTSVFTLKKCFELEFERLQGISNLELICAEFVAMDESRLTRKLIKKEKKKLRKQSVVAHKQIAKTNGDNNETAECCLRKEDQTAENAINKLNNSYDDYDDDDKEFAKTDAQKAEKKIKQMKNSKKPKVKNQNSSKIKYESKNHSSSSSSKYDSCCVTNSSRSTSVSSIFLVDEVDTHILIQNEETNNNIKNHDQITALNSDRSEINRNNEEGFKLLKDYVEINNDVVSLFNATAINNNEMEQISFKEKEENVLPVSVKICLSCNNSFTVNKNSNKSNICEFCNKNNAPIENKKKQLNVGCGCANNTIINGDHGTLTKLEDQSKSISLNELNHLNLLNSMSSSSTSSSSSSSSNTLSLSLNNFPNNDNNNHNNNSNNKNNNEETQFNNDYDFISNNFNNNTNSLNSNYDYFITDEEKMEYYANKSLYLTERRNRRELLKQKFQNLKMNANFKLQPRNVS